MVVMKDFPPNNGREQDHAEYKESHKEKQQAASGFYHMRTTFTTRLMSSIITIMLTTTTRPTTIFVSIPIQRQESVWFMLQLSPHG
jgi:hypothetical protein